MDIARNLANLTYLILVFGALWAAGAYALRVVHGRHVLSEAERLDSEHNLALSLRQGGLYLGMALGLAGVLGAPSRGFSRDLLGLLLYVPLTVGLLFAAWWINERWILRTVDNTVAVLKGNVAVGLVEVGSFLASGMLLKSAFSGQGSLMSGVVFFLLGQAALIGFFRLMEILSPYNDQHEIEAGNAALGLHFAGMLMALGIILAACVAGDFTHWGRDIGAFLLAAVKGVALLLAASWVADRVLVLHASVAEEISHERNYAAVVAGLGMKIGLALLIVVLL